ncbi:MAG: hypothetical protein JST00_31165 [Deltaproteobacteria bacterium]|nr:hypothetical protein [Deltaproteobacteria bacterium]
METLHLVGILGFGLLLVVGTLLVVVAAFSESVVWGLVCLFFPGAMFVFVARHWDRARTGAFIWILGVTGFLATSLTWTPKVKASPPAASARPTGTIAVRCPPATATDGFTKWCCDGAAWVEAARGSDCDSVFRPSEVCDSTTAGTTSTTACSSSSTTGKTRRR